MGDIVNENFVIVVHGEIFLFIILIYIYRSASGCSGIDDLYYLHLWP